MPPEGFAARAFVIVAAAQNQIDLRVEARQHPSEGLVNIIELRLREDATRDFRLVSADSDVETRAVQTRDSFGHARQQLEVAWALDVGRAVDDHNAIADQAI